MDCLSSFIWAQTMSHANERLVEVIRFDIYNTCILNSTFFIIFATVAVVDAI